ncbi:hypothetical protein MM239_05370 [Belliella sp. DSM 111904]|uniref:Uncharacterized protein n=1 Tax=Belliella filtrata TaxID=2923435 RepID=A0ABS9UXC9_9BACT|nr:hypothetical protein [Belliella filtrata]MCH7408816.1 hypothetical protein [Belliella filtrata]
MKEGEKFQALSYLKSAYDNSERIKRAYLKVEILNLLALFYKEVQEQENELLALSGLIKMKKLHEYFGRK